MSESESTTEPRETPHAGQPERWLSSPWRRMTVLFAIVLAASAYWAYSFSDAAEAMGWEATWFDFFLGRLVVWGSWALLFEPVFWFARQTASWFSSAWLIVLLHVPLSLAFVPFLGWMQETLIEVCFEGADGRAPFPPHPFRGRGAPGGERHSPGPDDTTGADVERRPRHGRLPRPRHWDRERRQQGLFYVRLLSYWAILGLGWTIHMHLRNREHARKTGALELRASELERELVSAQLSNLRSQLHPHFLFNALHSVGGLIRQDENEKAVDTLASLGGLLRAALDREQRQMVPLNEELDLVDRYIDVERQRLGDRLDVTSQVEAGASRIPVPSLILLPLVENAIKYAVAPRTEGGSIEIVAVRKERHLVLEVRDDGPGFPSEVLEGRIAPPADRSHIGLQNTRARLMTLFGSEASLSIENLEGGGGLVRVLLPVDLEREKSE